MFDCFLRSSPWCVCVWLEGWVCGELIVRPLIMWPVAVMECDSSVLCSGSLSFQPAKPIKHTLPRSPTASRRFTLHPPTPKKHFLPLLLLNHPYLPHSHSLRSLMWHRLKGSLSLIHPPPQPQAQFVQLIPHFFFVLPLAPILSYHHDN